MLAERQRRDRVAPARLVWFAWTNAVNLGRDSVPPGAPAHDVLCRSPSIKLPEIQAGDRSCSSSWARIASLGLVGPCLAHSTFLAGMVTTGVFTTVRPHAP